MDVIISSIQGREISRYWRITMFPTTPEERILKDRFGTLFCDVTAPHEIHQERITRLRFVHPEFMYTLALNGECINHRPESLRLVPEVIQHIYTLLSMDVRPRCQLLIHTPDGMQVLPGPIDHLLPQPVLHQLAD